MAWPQAALRFPTTLAVLVWFGLLILPLPARAADGLVYDVDLQVPEAQRKLLQNNLDLFRWRGNERMDEVQMQRLVNQAPAQIRSLLATEGFYSAQIGSKLDNVGDRWTVHLDIQPGEPVSVRHFSLGVVGPFDNGSSTSRDQLTRMRKDWALQAGSVFRHEDWEAAKRAALRDLLLDRYPAASIRDSQATVDSQARSVDLTLNLDSGPAFTFGKLQIEGLSRYPASIIERLNPIKPGEPYAQAKLLALQSHLQDSPYFSSADVHYAVDSRQPENVPVQVRVKENPARTLGLGVGDSTDSGPRGQIDYKDINLLDKAWRLTGNLKVDAKEQSLSSNLQFPLSGKGHQDSLTAKLNRSDVEGVVTRTITMGAVRNKILGKNETSWGLSYFRELQDVSGANRSESSSLVLSQSWIRRDVDSLLFPTRGYLLNLTASAATQALLSDQSFLRADGKAAWFRPLWSHGQLILRGELGVVAADSRVGIPSDLLFRTGGDQTVRGYAYQSLGVPDGTAVVGGRWLVVASGEYVHWFTSQWGGAVFLDAGDAADTFGELNPKSGYGVGVRWKSPVGPLNLDVAYGQATKSTRLHFAVGFSF